MQCHNEIFWKGEKLYIIKEKYRFSDRTALTIFDSTGCPFAIATINIPETFLEEDEVIIKNYAENNEILDVLEKYNIVKRTGRSFSCRGSFIYICKLLI